jgi:hypothetical protein
MPDFGIAWSQGTTTTTYKTGLALAAAAAAASGIQIRRFKIFDVIFGQSGPPNSTDTSIQFDVSRFAAFATTWVFGTNPAPNPDDAADPVFMGQVGVGASTEGTYAAQGSGLGLLNFVLNQRAGQRWIAKDGKELIGPATANNGIGIRGLVVTAGYTGPIAGVAQFTE